jgi:ABC-2 type transport system ATP-binding protein
VKYVNKSTVIEFNAVSKRYRDVVALDNVSLEIGAGEVFGYIGPNGAGKTTTMKILVGLIPDFQGSVSIDGRDIKSKENGLHRVLGYLPQEAGFQEWRTVDHVLTTLGRLSGLSQQELKERIPQVLESTRLSDVRYKRVIHLSGGTIQKVRLAQAILHDPGLLVLDEPMSGLDPEARHQLRVMIRDMANNGTTVFLSSHILSDVQDIADRIGILNHGQMLKVGTPDDLQSHFQVGNVVEVIINRGSRTLPSFGTVDGIEKVEEMTSNRTLLHMTHDADVDVTMALILRKLAQSGCQIRNLNLVRPSLEEVYLRFVGGDL